MLLDVPVSDVYSALQAQFGSIVVSQFNQYSRVWNVTLQSDAPYRRGPEDITKLYTRSNTDEMVPLSAMVTTKYVTGPDLMSRFNGFPAAQITGSASPGRSSGEAIKAMEEVAAEVLPQGYGFAWSGLAYQEKQSGGTSSSAFSIRPHHSLSHPRGPVRILGHAGIRHDGGALRHSRRPLLQLDARSRE